jgi:anhydro-N-acetylmuramic acid kinase
VLNLGGMANLTDLPPGAIDQQVTLRGWDTGPGNVLLDYWFKVSHPDSHEMLDRNGAFAAQGQVDQALLARLMDDPWFLLPPPKSTGREQFDGHWLQERLKQVATPAPANVQATLSQLSAESAASMLAREMPSTERLIVCGGGVYNQDLMARLEEAVARQLSRSIAVVSSGQMGVLPEHVEAAAFAWLGHCYLHRRAGNSASVTGARGPRVLGALYPGAPA